MAKVYEYRCEQCGDQVVGEYLNQDEISDFGHTSGGLLIEWGSYEFCGPLKRVWSGAFVWDKSKRGH